MIPSARHSLLFASTLVLLLSGPLQAQQRDTVAVGAWIRGSYLHERIEGRVVQLDDRSIALARGPGARDIVVVPRAGLEAAEVRTGSRRNTWRGVGRGLL